MNNNWTFEEIAGQEFWINENRGNITKLKEEIYIAMVPRVLKFGPFSSLEEAKKFLESDQTMVELSKLLDQYNENVCGDWSDK